jgi:hypothetical protein
MGWVGMGWDGMGCDWKGRDGMGWGGMGCDGMGCDAMRWNGMRCDAMRCYGVGWNWKRWVRSFEVMHSYEFYSIYLIVPSYRVLVARQTARRTPDCLPIINGPPTLSTLEALDHCGRSLCSQEVTQRKNFRQAFQRLPFQLCTNKFVKHFT